MTPHDLHSRDIQQAWAYNVQGQTSPMVVSLGGSLRIAYLSVASTPANNVLSVHVSSHWSI